MSRLATSMLFAGLLVAGLGADLRAQTASPDTAPSGSPVPCPVVEIQVTETSGATPAQVGIGGTVEAPTAGFALTLPDGWLWVVTDSSDVDVLSALVIGADPERGPAVAGLLSALPCTHTYLFDFVAVAPVLDSGPVAETCVGVSPATGESIEDILDLNTVPIIALGGEATTSLPVDLPSGSAGHIDSVQAFGVSDLGAARRRRSPGDDQARPAIKGDRAARQRRIGHQRRCAR